MADPSSPGGIASPLRRAAAIASLATAFAFLTGGNPIPDVRAGLDTLRAFWRKDPTSRRLEGRAAAYDRRFAAFVVRAAKELPPEAPGASLEAPGIPDWGGRFFAVYHFAPTPLLLSPDRVSPGWWTLKYPAPDVPSDLVQGSFDGGVLLRPAP